MGMPGHNDDFSRWQTPLAAPNRDMYQYQHQSASQAYAKPNAHGQVRMNDQPVEQGSFAPPQYQQYQPYSMANPNAAQVNYGASGWTYGAVPPAPMLSYRAYPSVLPQPAQADMNASAWPENHRQMPVQAAVAPQQNQWPLQSQIQPAVAANNSIRQSAYGQYNDAMHSAVALAQHAQAYQRQAQHAHAQLQLQLQAEQQQPVLVTPSASAVPPPPPAHLSAVPFATFASDVVRLLTTGQQLTSCSLSGFPFDSPVFDSPASPASLRSSRTRTSGSSLNSSGILAGQMTPNTFGAIGSERRARNSSANSGASSPASSLIVTPPSAHHATRVVDIASDDAANLKFASGLPTDINWAFDPAQPSRLNAAVARSTRASATSQSRAMGSRLQTSIAHLLSQTLLSPQVLFLALYYISRLSRHPTSLLLDQCRIAEVGPDHAELGSFKVFVAALIVANKQLDDNSYRNSMFAAVTALQVSDINASEIALLSELQWSSSVDVEEWQAWLQHADMRLTSKIDLPSEAVQLFEDLKGFANTMLARSRACRAELRHLGSSVERGRALPSPPATHSTKLRPVNTLSSLAPKARPRLGRQSSCSDEARQFVSSATISALG